MRGACGLGIDRAPHNGHFATAAAHPHVRVRLVAHVQSFQMKAGQLHVFRSPQARATSPSVPRGTKLIACIPPEFLPAGFTSYEDETVFLLTQTRPKVTVLRLPGTSVVPLVLTGP